MGFLFGVGWGRRRAWPRSPSSAHPAPTPSGSTTEDILATDSIQTVKEKLLALSTITGVAVESSGSKACGTTDNKVQVEFRQQFGDVPLLVGDASGLKHASQTPRYGRAVESRTVW